MVKWIDTCQVFQEVFSPSGLTRPLLAGAIFSFSACTCSQHEESPPPDDLPPRHQEISVVSGRKGTRAAGAAAAGTRV